MAKRGRKKKSKIKSLSPADKNHLKRILAKVRQIKANKATVSDSTGKVNTDLVASLVSQLAQANSDLQNFSNRGLNLGLPSNLATFNQIAARVAMIQQRLFQAQLGQIQK